MTTSDQHEHYRPGIADQRAVLAAARAILTTGDNDAAHKAAGSGSCPSCTAVAAIWLGITIAQQLTGAGFVNGPLAPRLLAMIAETERELRAEPN
jgi:hypothetical protein